VTFGGTLANTDVDELELVNCTGCTGFTGEIAKGGQTTRHGAVTATGDSIPTVTTPPSFTIPLRTPFALTGSGSDADQDPLTYLWEQNDAGGGTGTGLVDNIKLNGPLFRQFSVIANVSVGYWNRAFTAIGTGVNWSDLLGGGTVNGSTLSRGNVINYTTPNVGGFQASAAWGENDVWDVALRYAGEHAGFRIAGGIGYSSNAGGLGEVSSLRDPVLGQEPTMVKGSASQFMCSRAARISSSNRL